MRKYIYTFVMLLLLGACTNNDLGFEMEDPSATDSNSCVTVLENGDLQIGLNLQIDDMEDREVDTRSACVGNEGNIVDGWAFVFGEGSGEGATTVDGVTFADNSPLLQKVAFKMGSNNKIFVTLKPTGEDKPCFLRLMANVTDVTDEAINKLTAKIDATAGDVSDASTLADYKNISVSLIGYYNISYDDLLNGTVLPNPNELRTKKAGYPAASPGYAFPKGLTSESVEDFNKQPTINGNVTMVPVGSKVTIDVDAGCKFQLQEVYALNVAKRAMMRSTVLDDSGLAVASYDVPTNFGGTTKTAAVEAEGNSTVSKPIYIFPNEGDAPFSGGFTGQKDILGFDIEDSTKYPASGVKDADGVADKNPTYIIVKGKAEGYTVDGYYKIALINKTGGYTYDIIRNGHYQVNIYDVDNAGYRTAKEAEDGPSSEISYDVTIGASDDCRNIIKVSNNGLFSTEFDANMIYAQGYGDEGVDAEFQVKLIDNNKEDNFFTTTSTASVSVFEGGDKITLADGCQTVIADGVMKTIKFKVKGDGIVRLTCGDLIQDVRVYYKPLGVIIKGGEITTDAGDLFTDEVKSIEDFETGYNKGSDMITKSGVVNSNANNYTNRECRAKFYRSNGRGITKVYLRQASDFVLNTSYDNSAASATGGISGTNDIFSDPVVDGLKSTYTADINYQSTGRVYKLNTHLNGTYDTGRVMNSWKIGDAPIEFTAKGQFTTHFDDSKISSTFTTDTWSTITDNSTVTIDASYIGKNEQNGKYVAKIEDTPILTLSNIAGEIKEYKFNLEQSAAPYIDGIDLINGVYLWDCPVVGDCYDGWGTDDNVGKNVATSPTVYNAHYSPGPIQWNPKDFDSNYWLWTEAPDGDNTLHSDYTGGSKGKAAVSAGMNVQANPNNSTATQYEFEVNVNDVSRYKGKWKAFFDMRLINDAGELIIYRIMLRRDDSSQ